MIQTVLGHIQDEQFGQALIHEHVLLDMIGAEHDWQPVWSSDEVEALITPHLMAIRDQGFTGFVDCTPPYLGHDPLLLKRLSQSKGLHILTPTGCYIESKLPPFILEMGAEELATVWISDFEHGFGDTGIKPGFIKVAMHTEPLTPVERKIIRAATLASLATGMVVVCHVHTHGTNAFMLFKAVGEQFAEEDIPFDRLILAHTPSYSAKRARFDIAAEFAYCLEIAERGAYLSFDDGIGRPDSGGGLEAYLKAIQILAEHQLINKILISQDRGYYEVGKEGNQFIRPYTHLYDVFVPLLQAEIGPDIVNQLLVANPREAFALR